MSFLNPFSKDEFPDKKIKIIVDNREKNSLVISELIQLNIHPEFKQLPVADYLVKNIAIERKTLSDFKSSIKNKRIISQLLELKQYPNPLLILEGLESEDPYNSSSGLHENAFRGFILSILTDYKIPIIFTLNEKDTARYLSVLAKKQPKKDFAIRASKILRTDREKLRFILEGFPSIGPTTAKKLLEHFKNLKNLANATEEELKQLIGKRSEIIYGLLNSNF